MDGSTGEAQRQPTASEAAKARKHARALIRALGYQPGQVMWFGIYPDQVRLTLVSAEGVERVTRRLPGGNQYWGER